jgi:choline dehydrogenase-like flavoprotein
MTAIPHNSNISITTSIPESLRLKAYACIIGTGAAGSVLAYELSRQDKDVVMMEKGNYYDLNYIQSANEESLSSLWKNKGIFLSTNYSVNIGQGQCVGGSTMINYGICFEIPDPVFSYWRNAFGIKISQDELNDAYARVGRAINRRKIEQAGLGHELFKKGCDGLGYSCDWMDKAYLPGIGKQNALLAFLNKSKADKLKIYANCEAEKIIVSGKRAIEVRGIIYDPKDKKQRTIAVESKIVIVSAGPIASSEILLRNNIANTNGQVGKHMSLHPSSSVTATFDEKVNADDGMAMACYCDQFSVRKTGKPGFMLESVFVPPSQLSITMPAFGDANFEYVKKYDHYAMAGVLVHDEPNGRVDLNWSNDAIVNYEMGHTDQVKMTDGLKEAARIFFRAGAKNVITGHMRETILESVSDMKLIDKRGAGLGQLLVASVHPQGGNRMGENPANSVVNSSFQTHEIPNMYVCDASVFPTSIGVNPQLTVMALATIAADDINKV